MPSSKRNQLPNTRTPVYIDIWPESSSWSIGSSSSSCSHAPPSSLSKSPQVVLNMPRRMRDIDPTVTFVSPSVVIAKSSYIIVLDGAPIHNEDTKLECIGPYFAGSVISSGDGPLLYSTTLVPKFWEILCRSPDPTMYTIIQDVYRRDPAPLGRSSGRPRPVLIFSAEYHFRYSVHACTPPPSMTPYIAYHANSPFIANVNCAHLNLHEPDCPCNRHRMPLGQDSPQLHEDNMQSQLYKQCIPDVSLGDFPLINSMIDNHDSSAAKSEEMMTQSSFSSFPNDIRNYI
ncbi:uncharacterized protein F5891DRAFT_1114881 [Suillus fuscotomentosus]|uniref:Uncharacterized protein n=1 Tax=Suillus fuscotomentosus TaxID=1912939 RepID=A0AAD4HGI3_9AGAM|nr:uncharacterized protein F5891DRAFT_1114881 [Suillus fuscotomentosus]KAG1895677.1 hypothetical protein F5891DRAFT_1114881 [Suillus fuscotomentosus]